MLVFNRFFFFLWAGRDCCLGFSISHVTFSEVTSVWGVSTVAILKDKSKVGGDFFYTISVKVR